MIQFRWNEEKNEQLKRDRGIGFEQVVYAIESGNLLDVVDHHNPEQYPNQWIYIININHYVHLVPFVKEGKDIRFLKTIIPSRKATRAYLRKKGES